MRIAKIFFFSTALAAFVNAADLSLHLNTESELKAKQKSMQDHCEKAATLPCAVGVGRSNGWDDARKKSKEEARAKLSRIASKMDSKVVGNAVITKEESGKITDSVTGKSSYVVITMLTMKSLTVTPVAPEPAPTVPVPVAEPEPAPEPAPVHEPVPAHVHTPAPTPAPVVHTPAPAPAPVVHTPVPAPAPAPAVHTPAPVLAPVAAPEPAPAPVPVVTPLPPPPAPPPPAPTPPPAATEPPKQQPAPTPPPPERHTRGKVILNQMKEATK